MGITQREIDYGIFKLKRNMELIANLGVENLSIIAAMMSTFWFMPFPK